MSLPVKGLDRNVTHNAVKIQLAGALKILHDQVHVLQQIFSDAAGAARTSACAL
jgi:hypothetical protein